MARVTEEQRIAELEWENRKSQRAFAECHKRLDAAGVPSADGAPCNDPDCQCKLGHRIKWLVAENVRLRNVLKQIAQPALGGKTQQYLAQAALNKKD